MEPNNGDERENRGVEFMLKEYEQVHNHLLDEIRKSEQRVNLFLTIASLAGSGVVILAQTSSIAAEAKSRMSLGVLAVLLTYGVMTLNRLNARSAQLIAYNKLLTEIHRYFASQDPQVAAYVRYLEELFRSPKHRPFGSRVLSGLRGALQDFMIVTNALICGGITLTALSGKGISIGWIVGLTLATIAGAITVLYTYHYSIRERLPPFE